MELSNISFNDSQDIALMNGIESPKIEITQGNVFGAILLIVGTSVGGC